MNKQQLASKIWSAANKMRSKIAASEYKDYILGLMFYKFLSEKEEQWLEKQGLPREEFSKELQEDGDNFLFIRDSLGYFITYDNLFSTWLTMGTAFNISNVRDGLNAFNRVVDQLNNGTVKIPDNRKIFSKIFTTLETGLSKLGDTAGAQTKAIRELLLLIDEIPAVDSKQDYDMLGFIYEYLIGMFAANAGKKAGEFYTPHEVAILMAEIVAEHLKDRKNLQIYDPTSGSGSLLINIGNAVDKYMDDKDSIKYYAQELIESTYNLTRMNLIMRGIDPDNIKVRNGDTLDEDWPFFDDNNKDLSYHFMSVDAVVSNPPYSQHWDPTYKDVDPRFKDYGVAPKTKADYAFLLHDLYHVNENGIMCIVMPHGVLFRGNKDDNSEGKIRMNLIERNKIAAIIGLPSNIFFGTGIPTIIMVLKHKREDTNVLFIDGSHGFVKDGKQNKLRAQDIRKLVDTVVNRWTIPGFSRLVTKEEIQKNDYNLNIPRYVDSSEKPENWDIYATMFGGIPHVEMVDFDREWQAFPSLMNELVKKDNKGYYRLNTTDIKSCVANNNDVQNFKNEFAQRFQNLPQYLYGRLVERVEQPLDNLNIVQEKEILTNDVFERMKDIQLLDRYEAYQLLDDQWKIISLDLETLKKEGFEAVRKVDPNMVIKKKDDVEKEVQDGWKGRIIPFELVWSTLLNTDYQMVLDKQNSINDVNAQWQSMIEEMTEEEKDFDIWKEDEDKLDSKSFGKFIKGLKTTVKKEGLFSEDTPEYKWLQVDDLMTKEKQFKKELKKLWEELITKTISTIENLSETDAKDLLNRKWVVPFTDAILAMPDCYLKNFANKLQKLSEKYAVTLNDVEQDIQTISRDLGAMLDDLTGDLSDLEGLQEFKKLLGGN